MTVKIRWIRNKWYIIVHYKGERVASAVGPDYEEAERAKDDVEREIKLHGVKALRRMKRKRFEDFGDKWVKDLQNTDLKQSTRERYASSFKVHLRGAFSGPIDRINYRIGLLLKVAVRALLTLL